MYNHVKWNFEEFKPVYSCEKNELFKVWKYYLKVLVQEEPITTDVNDDAGLIVNGEDQVYRAYLHPKLALDDVRELWD